MVDRARELLTGHNATVVQADLETFDVPAAHFDVVLARLCLHYVPDVRAVLLRLVAALVPGGRLVLTAIHPLLTAPLALDADEPREAALVDDYFVRGPRQRSWLGGQVTWHHRTVEEWVQAVLSSGLTLTSLSECPPQPEMFAGAPDELRRRLRAPSILLLAGQRP